MRQRADSCAKKCFESSLSCTLSGRKNQQINYILLRKFFDTLPLKLRTAKLRHFCPTESRTFGPRILTGRIGMHFRPRHDRVVKTSGGTIIPDTVQGKTSGA